MPIEPGIILSLRAVILAEHCDTMCKMGTGVATTMSDNKQGVSYVSGFLTVRSPSVHSVSLSKTETSVNNPGDDQGCHLEPRRWGRQEHCDSTYWSVIA